MDKEELKVSVFALVEAINTKPKKTKSCKLLAKLCYEEIDTNKDQDIINEALQDILGRYKTEFLKLWCNYYTMDGNIDLAFYIVNNFVNSKNMADQDYNYAKGIIFIEIAFTLPSEPIFLENFPLLIAEALTVAKNCKDKTLSDYLVRMIVFLFRKKNISDKQILSVFNHFDNPDTKDWSIWSILGQGFASKNYELKFQIILQYDEYNDEVIIMDLKDLIEDINNDKKLNGNDKKELLQKFKLYIYERSFSDKLKEKIITLLQDLIN